MKLSTTAALLGGCCRLLLLIASANGFTQQHLLHHHIRTSERSSSSRTLWSNHHHHDASTSSSKEESDRRRTCCRELSKADRILSISTPSLSQQASAFVAAMVVFLSTIALSPSGAIADDSRTVAPQHQQQTIQQHTMLVAAANDEQQQPQQQQRQETVVEEVWNLINKYYIDATFNNQDWEQVKKKVMAEANKGSTPSDANDMKIITNMVQSLGDKYTRVLDTQQYASIQKYDLIGVGVTLMPNSQKDIIVGAPPIEGSSSAKAGLKVGDFVTAVNGKPTRGRNAFDIIDQISEQSNAKTVTFTILRKQQPSSLQSVGDEDNGVTFDVTMDRQTMQMKDPVQYKLSEKRKDGTNVGYIRISEFNSLVNSSLQKALQDLQQQGANAYVLDLRGNTGGAFQSAVEISGMFLRDRVSTYVVDRNQVELPFRTPKMQDLAIDPKTPMVLWLDGMSASASEVLAGSLHDNCRAVTMGDNSFGKGLIQAVYGLKNGAGLVLTVARYVTPSGYEIQGKGVIPDISGNMPAPVFVPGLSSDTSKVDFQDIAKRLDANYCEVPAERVPSTPPSESLVSSG